MMRLFSLMLSVAMLSALSLPAELVDKPSGETSSSAEQVQPPDEPMEHWDGWAVSYQAEEFGENLIVTVTRNGADVVTEGVEYPGGELNIQLGSSGLCVSHYAGMVLDEESGYQKSAYSKAYDALCALGLPNVTVEPFSPVNSPELRAEVSKYFRVTLNGEPVTGNLWWSQGNNHRDLCFDFDQPVALRDGDVLKLWGGMPESR